jgi:hypothetical protein
MSGKFFSIVDPPDEVYRALAASDFPHCRDARDFIEAEWPRVGPYLDADFQEKAARSFRSHFWEFYLVASLRFAGYEIVPRAERTGRDAGPDVLLKDGTAIEAVTATAGAGADAVIEGELGVARPVPDGAIRLRLLNALDEKLRKLGGYHAKGIHSEKAPFIIAVNAGDIPSVRAENTVPRIVRTLFPIGHLQYRVNVDTLEVVDSSYTFEGSVKKVKGTEIPTDGFLSREKMSGVSAVLYSCVNAVNRTSVLGGDFMLVHNPNAACPIPLRYLPVAAEFTFDGKDVRHTPGLLAREA